MSNITARGLVFASLSAVAALANIAVAVPAHAAEPQAPTAVVHYGDLDLGTPAGVAMLDHRIHAAANKVCGPVDPSDLDRRALVVRCRQTAVAGAAPGIAIAIAGAHDGVTVASAASLRVATR